MMRVGGRGVRSGAAGLVILACCCAAGEVAADGPECAPGRWPAVAEKDAAYLRDVAAETWACIAHFVEPETGLPYDTSARPEYTSATNLGYYAAACAVAAELGFTSRADATARVRQVLDAYGRLRHYKGFSQSWNHVRTLAPAPHDPMISLLDSGNMVAGFVVARQALPDVRQRVDHVLADLDWAAFYDAERGLLFGGYNLARGEIDRGWHIGDYAGDGRMAAFWAIAVGAAPPESWDRLGRATEQHYGLTIYRPAWLGGGLFMQSQDGLFLDERGTPIGRSTADFAYAQMLCAESLRLPAWGWSACAAPDGRYLGWGGLEVAVVTPHAAGMAAMLYPHKAARCLRALEESGARAPFVEQGQTLRFGFRDSVNVETRAVSDRYLPPLDQAMLLFGLANALEDRRVQRLFESHPTVQRGRSLIAEYGRPVEPEWLKELERRDREPLRVPQVTGAAGRQPVLIDNFEAPAVERNRLGGKNETWTRDAADDAVSVRITRDEVERSGAKTGALRIDYDVDSPRPAFGGVTIELQHANGSGCDTLELCVRGTPDNLKIELHGSGGIGVTRLRGVRPDGWSALAVPLVQFGGMITDWTDLEKIVLVFEDGVSQPKVGTLWLDDVRLVRRK